MRLRGKKDKHKTGRGAAGSETANHEASVCSELRDIGGIFLYLLTLFFTSVCLHQSKSFGPLYLYCHLLSSLPSQIPVISRTVG
jgi:hypothetical protein